MPKKSGASPTKFTRLMAMTEPGKKHKKHKHDSQLGPSKKSKEVKKTNNFPM